jgi:hypothetical protein
MYEQKGKQTHEMSISPTYALFWSASVLTVLITLVAPYNIMRSSLYIEYLSVDTTVPYKNIKKLRGLYSASELSRPSDRSWLHSNFTILKTRHVSTLIESSSGVLFVLR